VKQVNKFHKNTKILSFAGSIGFFFNNVIFASPIKLYFTKQRMLIVKGVIFDIKKFAIHDGPGIRTTVFLKGCLLRCWWCHNPESHKELPELLPKSFNNNGSEVTSGRIVSVDQILNELQRDIIFFDESGGGVTFSGGEPLVQIEFLETLLKGCKDLEIHTAIDTSGYAPYESFDRLYDYTDLFLYDLKLMNDEQHIKYTDVSNELILENLNKLSERGKKIMLRIPLIPDITDTDKNLLEISKFISGLKNINEIALLPYNKIAESKYRRFSKENKLGNLVTQSKEKLDKISQRFYSLSIPVKIGG
jgi:pyruvate formate lyase activating enzyme